ncbi:unnamed protein product [Soboliphyme baturini]|uniref:Archease domain-containing protein n=1 Tax=Soboliphyme baturini TaxID=241478 RepID=A0A183J9P3_9BILA|nr:unnamed protein product [Soboliphyme baturini]
MNNEPVIGDVSDIPEGVLVKYEYLDHTADVQIHSWGDCLAEAFEQAAVGLFGYMTDITTVRAQYTYDIQATGQDDLSLLYHFLDEWLFAFSAEPYFIAKAVKIIEFDRVNFKICARGWGETFDLSKHPQGAEVKAITYSNMQVYDEETRHEIFVIIDI